MVTILRTIFWNIIAMKTYVIWFKLHWNLFIRIQWTICLHLSSSPRWVLNVLFFNSWLQLRFPLKCHCKEMYHFMNAHTLALLISRVCIYKHNSFILIYILRRRKSIHTPDNADLFYIIEFHAYACVLFSIDEIKIFIIIIIYELIATGWRIHVSGI